MKKDDAILSEAQSRYKLVADYESVARDNFRYDRRFDAGDSINLYQWPEELFRPRLDQNKPCLTVNRVHQHVLQICNDALRNRPSVNLRPVGNGATFKAAEILEGMVRYTEYISQATDAYDTATKNMCIGGIGWWRVTTDYVSPDSFDQELKIVRVPDPLSIYMDPDIREIDGSDANYAFAFSSMARDLFDLTYPDFADDIANSPLGEERHDDDALDGKHVRLCEYYRRVQKPDRLHMLIDGSSIKESQAKDTDVWDVVKDQIVHSRDVTNQVVEWFLIGGNRILDRNVWLGSTIPLIRIVGEEHMIDGIMDRRGHVRSLTDSQRMYNVMNSAAVEAVGLQTKVPWLVSNEAIEGNEVMWENANRKNYSYLVWNSWDDVGQREVPQPTKIEAANYPSGYAQGLVQASNDMNAASGQQAASFGIETNERSGKAINERERAASNATYHFVDHLAIGIRYTGRILLEMIPLIYDTPRTLKILGQDSKQITIALDPSMAMAHRDATGADAESFSDQQVAAVLNPSVGRYSVEADVGPNYGTRRQEAFNAISQILMQNEQLAMTCGDLLFRSADFPLADEIAERLRNMVPKQALGQAADPQLQQAQMALAQQHQVMMQQEQVILELKNRQLIAEQQKEINTYRAETDRMKAIGAIDQEAMRPVIRQLVSEALGTAINPLIHAHALEGAVVANAMQQLNPQQANPTLAPGQAPAQSG